MLINSCWVVIRHQMCCKTYCSPALPSVVKPDVSSYVYRGLGCPSLFLTCAQLTFGAAPVLRFSKCRIYSCVHLLVAFWAFCILTWKREGRLSLQGFQFEGCRSPGSGFSNPRQMCSSWRRGSALGLMWDRVSRWTRLRWKRRKSNGLTFVRENENKSLPST